MKRDTIMTKITLKSVFHPRTAARILKNQWLSCEQQVEQTNIPFLETSSNVYPWLGIPRQLASLSQMLHFISPWVPRLHLSSPFPSLPSLLCFNGGLSCINFDALASLAALAIASNPDSEPLGQSNWHGSPWFPKWLVSSCFIAIIAVPVACDPSSQMMAAEGLHSNLAFHTNNICPNWKCEVVMIWWWNVDTNTRLIH